MMNSDDELRMRARILLNIAFAAKMAVMVGMSKDAFLQKGCGEA